MANILGLISKYESGNRNVMNYIGDSTHTAQGYFQLTNTNWRNLAPGLGIDLSQYPNAMSAPYSVQATVANQLLNGSQGGAGIQNWADFNPKLNSALRAEGLPTSGRLFSEIPNDPSGGTSGVSTQFGDGGNGIGFSNPDTQYSYQQGGPYGTLPYGYDPANGIDGINPDGTQQITSTSFANNSNVTGASGFDPATATSNGNPYDAGLDPNMQFSGADGAASADPAFGELSSAATGGESSFGGFLSQMFSGLGGLGGSGQSSNANAQSRDLVQAVDAQTNLTNKQSATDTKALGTSITGGLGAVASAQTKVADSWQATAKNLFGRAVVIIVGFIFVGVGLSMFKTTNAVARTVIPGPVQRWAHK